MVLNDHNYLSFSVFDDHIKKFIVDSFYRFFLLISKIYSIHVEFVEKVLYDLIQKIFIYGK